MSAHQIAVAIPTYRRPDLLLELVRTIPSNIPVSVSDNDASLSSRAHMFPENVAIHHAAELLPIFANWNRAVSTAPTEAAYVLIPSDDDLYLPTAWETIQSALDLFPDADMYVFGCDFVDGGGSRSAGWCPRESARMTKSDGFLPFETGVEARMPGVLFRRQFFDAIGGFDERFELTAADSELIQRAALLGTVVFIPEVIGLYRVWNGSLTHSRQATDLWMQEVALWTGKIAHLLNSGCQPTLQSVDVSRFKDEILARNLLAGLSNLIAKSEFAEARVFSKRYPTPQHARHLTRLRLLRRRWQLWARSR